uniref:CUB domain-containing protein n=1 Tax=Clastoptera arizonana TaxID=38151 RepID=A0A1B6CXJ7_9HEMI
MYILYNSLKNFHGTFKMLYTATDKGKGCGGRLLGEYGTIIPVQSRKDSVCRWDVSVPHSSSVDLKFIDFNIGSDDTCQTDYLQIVETGDGIGQKRYQFCGQNAPKSLQLSTNSFYIRYVTSIYNDGTEWILRFSSKQS